MNLGQIQGESTWRDALSHYASFLYHSEILNIKRSRPSFCFLIFEEAEISGATGSNWMGNWGIREDMCQMSRTAQRQLTTPLAPRAMRKSGCQRTFSSSCTYSGADVEHVGKLLKAQEIWSERWQQGREVSSGFRLHSVYATIHTICGHVRET